MLDDRTDALFPPPQSPAGKLLSHLVARQIPGTPFDTTTAGVARDAGLHVSEAAAALAKLADDGLVMVEPGSTRDTATVTVLLAPPLEEYGIHPKWAEADTPAQAIRAAPDAPTIPVTPAASGASTASTRSAAPPAAGQARPRPRGQEVAGQSSGPEHAPTGEAPNGGAGMGLPAATATPARDRTSAAARRGAPAATTQPLPLPEAPETIARGPARRGEPAGVDETALVRGFVDRFERLLAELDEWKRRAHSAEERNATTEKLLRSAERRAETAEARLAEAQERLRTWAELTRRMQQLSRQADGPRGRAPAARSRLAEMSPDAAGAVTRAGHEPPAHPETREQRGSA